jgi:pimeloyl-ACP methyl ester carboxylesterase
MIISEVCRRRNQRIKGLVYLAAFLLPSGKTPRDVMYMDTESLLPGCLRIDTARGVSWIAKECARSVFYGDCSEQDAAWATSQLQPEPLIPSDAVASDAPSGELPARVPRFYIQCLQDKALGPSVQRWMYTEGNCDAVYSLHTSHSPFLSAPAALAQHLLDIDQSVTNRTRLTQPA